MTTLLRSWGSRQILILLGVLTTTMLLIHPVGMVTFSVIPLLSKSSSFSLTLSLLKGQLALGMESAVWALPEDQ